MVHRRKNSHPVCKARRNLALPVWNSASPESETKEILDEGEIATSSDSTQLTPTEHECHYVLTDDVLPECTSDVPASPSPTLEEAEKTDNQQLSLPDDLFKDFEAVRTQTKMDTTDLMRRLLKEYQSTVSHNADMEAEAGGKSAGDSNTTVPGFHVSAPNMMSRKESTPMQGPRAQEDSQLLDLSVSPKKKDTGLSKTGKTSICRETDVPPSIAGNEQPLDLSVAPNVPMTRATPVGATDIRALQGQGLDMNSIPMNMAPVQKGDNCMYMYPVCYTGGDLGGVLSPVVAGVMSPGSGSHKLPPDPNHSDLGVINTNMTFGTNFADINAIPLPPAYQSPTPSPRPPPVQCQPQDTELPHDSKRALPKYFRMSGSKPAATSGISPPTPRYQKPKEEKEMKVISENTSYPGVYTSVLKLPWSRRTRTKKANVTKKMKQEAKQQALMMVPGAGELPQVSQTTSVNEGHTSIPQHHDSMTLPTLPDPQFQVSKPELLPGQSTVMGADPTQPQSVMMVYPNTGFSAMGKPVRKRGRPPKLPMLARLLQQSNKRKKDKVANATLQAQLAQQAQASGGMVLYNGSGQVLSAFGGMPVQQMSMSAEQAQIHGQNLLGPQAQLIGQFQLQPQFAPGQVQLVPQGQTQLQQVTGQPTQFLDAGVQPQCQDQVQCEGHTEVATVPPMVPSSIAYTFQPVFIPTPVTTTAPDTCPAPDPPQVIDSQPETSIETPDSQDQSTSCLGGLTMTSPDTHVMAHADTNTISTMSTTSIANTGSGAIYQEMILSSKSLVDIKPRRRQTAIQLLKSKSNDQNFLCTSFRIRPRLVAQAQAQRERLAAKCIKNIAEAEARDTDSKNSNCPQNDEFHFGETKRRIPSKGKGRGARRGKTVPPLKIKIKQEAVEFSDITDAVEDTSDPALIDTINIKKEIVDNELDSEHNENSVEFASNKRFLLHDLSANSLSHDYFDDNVSDNMSCDSPVARETGSSYDDSSVSMDSVLDDSMSQEMFQELYHCKVCNDILPLEEKASHWRKHNPVKYVCKKCGSEYKNFKGNDESVSKETLHCDNCHENITKEDIEINGESYGHTKLLCCDDCGETFKSFNKLCEHQVKAHNDAPHGKREYSCDKCGKIYHNARALLAHRKAHRNKTTTLEGKQRFHGSTDAEKHMDVQHGDRKQYYHCIYDGCSKKFLKNFHLQEHIRVKHFNIKAFQCPWPGCPKEFAAERHMKVHLLIHRDEKPLKCDYCDYRCRQRSAMNWHMRKHPEVPYKYKRYVNSPSASAPESE